VDYGIAILPVLFFLVALLYACVGHAGASGYLAIMALAGIAPATIKPTALALNILVAIIASFKFYRVGAFSKKIFIPLIITSIPCAYIGGLITLPGYIYKPLIGAVLIYSAIQSFYTSKQQGLVSYSDIKRSYLLMAGAGLGFLSGLSGVGGGIFLSPLLLLIRAEQPKVISGIAAAFILVNSISGLMGAVAKGATLPPTFFYWAIAVVMGGYIGAEIGSKKLSNPMILKVLAIVLIVAGIKMLLTL
jgi:uncharacterized protein